MIFSEAMRSLKKDRVRSFFYWLTFALTTMFIFLFFAISCNIEENAIVTGIEVLVILICSMDIFSVNSFFVNAKGKDMAVRLICGATYTFLSAYLLIQTLLFLLAAVPFGIAGAFVVLPLLNSFLSADIVITSAAIGRTGLMLGFIVFWIVLLNLSFAYKSAAGMMINGQGSLLNGKANTFYTGLMSGRIRSILTMILYLGPVLLLLFVDIPPYVPAVLGFLGFWGMLGNTAVPYLDNLISSKYAGNPEKNVYYGFLRMDIRQLKGNLLLFTGSAVLLCSLLHGAEYGSLEHLLILISYLMMNLLLSLAVTFKYATVQSGRTKHYKTLSNLGFTEDNLKTILSREVRSFYLFTACTGSLYIFAVLVYMAVHGSLHMFDAGIVLLGFFVPVLICRWVSFIYYKNAIFPHK